MTNEVARQNESYKDLDLDFIAHPASGDIVKKTGEDAIKRAMRNLLFLKLGEIGFMPKKGSGLKHYLFELITPATIELITREIFDTLALYEPRIITKRVIISEDVNPNGINIVIEFEIINHSKPSTLSLLLQRIR